MNEIQQIVAAVDGSNGHCFLATVVDVAGSSYRRPGARMLILPGGGHIGSISGGCLERDLCRTAPVIAGEGPTLISFDTRSERVELAPRYNTGCAGVVYVLVERVTEGMPCPTRPMRDVLSTGRSKVLGTVYRSDGMDRFPLGLRVPGDELAALHDDLHHVCESVGASGVPVCCHLTDGEASARVFMEKLAAPKSLWIFGSGDDAMPLSRIARELGWTVSVIDDRPVNLTHARFEGAHRLVASPIGSASRLVEPSSDVAAVVMTHSLPKDVELVPWLLASTVSYVGLLGPKVRTGRLMAQLAASGRLPDESALSKLRSPIGLDIGADSAAQIAVAIVAEIVASEHERRGGHLHDRSDPIHAPVAHRLIELDRDTDSPSLDRDVPVQTSSVTLHQR
ncbi:MAG: XdhC family protein [Phycisphaerae bacterium]